MVSMKRELTVEKYQKVMLCILFIHFYLLFLTGVVSWCRVIQVCDMRGFGLALYYLWFGLCFYYLFISHMHARA